MIYLRKVKNKVIIPIKNKELGEALIIGMHAKQNSFDSQDYQKRSFGETQPIFCALPSPHISNQNHSRIRDLNALTEDLVFHAFHIS